MRNLLIVLAAVSLVACGDDAKKSATSNNTTPNNTTSNNTTSNNTTGNNTTGNNTTGNNTTSNNTTANNTSSPQLELGDDNALISSLDVDEVCMKGAMFFNTAFTDEQAQKIECSATAFFLADDGTIETDEALQAACQAEYDACMAEPFTQEVDPGTDCGLDFTGCEATVGVFEACIEAQIAQSLETIDLLSCSTATLGADPLENQMEPSACIELNAACPNLFGN